jgi:hypothetical protein
MTTQTQDTCGAGCYNVTIQYFVPEWEFLDKWLIEEFKQWTENSSPYGTIVGVSLVARMGSMFVNAPLEVCKRQTQRVLANDCPMARAFEWFKPLSQSQEIVAGVLSHATRLAISLQDEIPDLENEVVSVKTAKDRWRAANHLVRWLLERDQLEGVHMMLSSAGNKDLLMTLIDHLDKVGKDRIKEVCRKVADFEFEPGSGPPWLKMPSHPRCLPKHPHLLTVFCREMDAWWGRAAYGIYE